MAGPWELLSSSGLVQGLLLLLLLLLALYCTFLWPFRQFPDLPQQKPHWLLGNNKGEKTMVENVVDFYTDMKEHKFCIFWEGANPCVFVNDLGLIKKIMVEDFDHFEALGFIDQKYLEQVGKPFGLADASGDDWKVLKKLVTPAFSGPRVKKAAKAVNQVGDKMLVYIEDALRKGETINVETLTGQFAMTAIGSVAFGVDINCFKDKENDFMKFGNRVIKMWRWYLMEMFPNVMRWFKINLLDPGAENFFRRLGQSIVSQRRSSTVEHNDVLHSLIAAAKESPGLMTPSMMFQTIVQFFTDGYFTYTEQFAGILYLLAAHPEVQVGHRHVLEDKPRSAGRAAGGARHSAGREGGSDGRAPQRDALP
jgi:cytochrome P450